MRMRFLMLGAVMGASSLVFACSALLDLQPPPDAVSDADGPSGDDGGADVPTIDPGCPIRYVSTARGSDTNDGCRVDSPLATVTGAIRTVGNAGAQGYNIRVTAGAYNETDPIIVALPGALSGGWDENYKTQTPATATGATVLRFTNPSSQNKTTLTLSPRFPAETPVMTQLSGFQIVGPDAVTIDGTVAVRVQATTANPIGPVKINACDIVGSDGPDSRALATSSTTPDVFGNTITSGTFAGAAAVELNNGTASPTAHLHGNFISGGNAPKGDAGAIDSLAVLVANVIATEAAGDAIEGNTIRIQSGTGSSPTMSGIQVSRATVDLLANTITSAGGSQLGESTVGITGVNIGAHTTARIAGNRIASGGSGNLYGDYSGIRVNSADSVTIVNNMIYAGEPASGSLGGSATGVYVNTTTSALIADNSIFTGYSGNGRSAFAIWTGMNQTDTVIQANILASPGASDWGLKIGVCATGVATLENNLFVGQGLGTLNIIDCNKVAAAPTDIAGIAPYVMHSSGNLILKGQMLQCSTGDVMSMACLVDNNCPASGTCLNEIFENFDSNGISAFETGWHLSSDVPCAVAKGALPLPADAGVLDRDYYGAPRPSSGGAIGAAQLVDDAGRCN